MNKSQNAKQRNGKGDWMEKLEEMKKAYYSEIYKAAKENDRETFRNLFLKLHTKDQTEIFHLLYPDKKRKIADFIEPIEFAPIFEFMEFEDQEEATQYLPSHYMAEVFNEMASDNVSQFLLELDEHEKQPYLNMMDREERERVEEILSYEPETAGSIMTKEFISVTMDQTVAEVISKLREIGHDAETIYYIYVVDHNMELHGVVSLRDLILSPDTEKIDNIMSTQVLSVPISTDQEIVARLIQEYDLLALPIVNNDQVIVGIVTVDDIMDVLEIEVTEDFQEFSAISPSDEEEPNVFQIAKGRIPWIVILIFLGMVTAGLITTFEDTLESVVALAAFIPIIMDAAGNVGTQSLAVSVRELSLEEEGKEQNLLDKIRKELGAGFMIGLAAMAALILVVMFLYNNLVLALIIGVSLLLTLTMSAVVGAIVPVVIKKMNFDPAIASGPFITTINDTLGLLIYFSIATYLLNYI